MSFLQISEFEVLLKNTLITSRFLLRLKNLQQFPKKRKIYLQKISPKKTKVTKKAKNVETDDYQTINEATALWTRNKGEIKDEEYKEFYKYLSHDVLDPLIWSHNRVEGKFDYTSLLYIPSSAPFDLHNYEAARGLKLYIQRTFIMDDASQFLPRYLRFVKGVLDSGDLPLNISREILQGNSDVDSMRSALTKEL